MPLATGKFSICTAKMNADTRPASATCFSWRVSADFLTQTESPPIAAAAAPTDVPGSMKPSGMCIGPIQLQVDRNCQ